MATRSTIAIQNLDGTINQVYCHCDGYLSNNGVLLHKFYNTRELVENLISKGGIFSLGEYVSDEPKSFDRNSDDYYTSFYSYRGEVTEIRHFKDFEDYEQNHQFEEFEYIFTKDDVWSVFDGNEWHDLEYLITEQEIPDPYDN
jgi:hypothetical protein